MANYATLIAAIQSVITQNGNNEITGPILQQTLISVVNSLGSGYQFIGIATPETTPGTPDQKVFYIGSAGTYPNFGPAVIPDGNLAVFYYDSSWHYGSVAFPLGNGAVTESKLATALANKLFASGYKFAGIATPQTTPGTPNQNVFYIGSAGEYSNFGTTKTVDDGYLGFFEYNNGWSFETIKVGETSVVRFIAQTLTDQQKQQARDNIGAVSTTDFSELSQEVGEYVDDTVVISPGTWTDGKLINADPEDATMGQEENSTAYSVTGYRDIHLHQGRILHYTRQTTASAISNAGLCFYDAAKVLISGQLCVRNSSSGYVWTEILIPVNAYYVRFTIGTSLKSNFGAYVVYAGEYISGLGLRVQQLEGREITVEKNNLLVGGEKVLDGIGFNSAIIGIGDSLSPVYLQLVRGQSYRIHIVNPDWARSSATSGMPILMLRGRNNDAWDDPIVRINSGSTVSAYYDFTMPTCEYLQLGIRADVGVFVYFYIEKLNVAVGTVDEYRNIHIALMNKYAERYGANLSTFLASNGSSKICAKDIALLCLASIENNLITSFWGKKVVNAPVFGPASRLDTYESTYTDENSHPMVADLSNYYHIFGGKTGSGGTPSRGRNLVVAVKSKVDEKWLVGCVLSSDADVQGNNRFSVMKELFDMLEQRRTGATVNPASLACQGAYALVVPDNGNLQNYGDYPFVSVAKNATTIIDSHSIVKLVTALVATDWILPYELLTFTSADPYGGTSGNMYSDGDQLFAIDALISMLLTSSSIAARCIARYVGMNVITKNGGMKLYSFRLLGRTAYGSGNQTWLEWLNSPDYLVWSANTGKTLSCAGSSSSVVISSGGSISGVTGGSIISPNTIYS